MTNKWIPIEFLGHSKGDDFEVVSMLAMMHDYSVFPYSEELDNNFIKFVFETPFDELATEFVYDVGDNIDIYLATTLGLGVISYNDKLYLYNSLFDEDDDYEQVYRDMHLRLGVYHQIKNPTHQDTKLEVLLKTKGAVEYLLSIMLVRDRSVINTLFDIFDSQKGGNNNVIQFPKK